MENMTKEVIWNWPKDTEAVFSVLSDGSICYHENVSIMDYEDIIKAMAKDISIAHSKTVDILTNLDKFFQDTAKIKSV